MNRLRVLSGISLALVLVFSGATFAETKPAPKAVSGRGESITITTYYPSPQGSYDQLTTASNTYLATENGAVGIGTKDTSGYKLFVNGSAFSSGGWSNISDQRLKKDLKKLSGVIEKIEKINGLKFNWRKDDFKEMNLPEARQIGMIAQEMEKEFPELVTTDGLGYKAIAYDKFTAVLLEALKEQQGQIEDLAGRIAALEKKNSK